MTRARSTFSLGLMAALAACGGVDAGRGPVGGRVPMAGGQPIELPVRVEGVGYLVRLAPGLPGRELTAAGAVPVPGLTVAVRGAARALAEGDGALAKTVAQAACRDEGRRFNDRAVGDYTGAGVWEFRGGCA